MNLQISRNPESHIAGFRWNVVPGDDQFPNLGGQGPSPSPISHLITISPFLKTAAVRQVVYVVTLRIRNKISESHPWRKLQKKV